MQTTLTSGGAGCGSASIANELGAYLGAARSRIPPVPRWHHCLDHQHRASNHQQTINTLPLSFSPPSPPDDTRSTRNATSTFRGHLTSGLRQSLPAHPLQRTSRLQCPPPLVGRHRPCPLPACQQQGHDTMTGSEQERARRSLLEDGQWLELTNLVTTSCKQRDRAATTHRDARQTKSEPTLRLAQQSKATERNRQESLELGLRRAHDRPLFQSGTKQPKQSQWTSLGNRTVCTCVQNPVHMAQRLLQVLPRGSRRSLDTDGGTAVVASER